MLSDAEAQVARFAKLLAEAKEGTCDPQETDLGDAGALSKAFRQHLGVSSSAFRQLQRPQAQGSTSARGWRLAAQ
jgi:hypothetical protein